MPTELQPPPPPAAHTLAELYEADEVAWLDTMAGLAAAGRRADLDLVNLQEYLESMSRSDKRAVKSHLVVLLQHLLKWEYQPERRGTSWLLTIQAQQETLADDFDDSATLRRHAEAVLEDAYQRARRRAVTETRLPQSTFPNDCPYTLDAALAAPPADDPTAAE